MIDTTAIAEIKEDFKTLVSEIIAGPGPSRGEIKLSRQITR